MKNLVIVAVLVIILTLAIGYIIKAKKSGAKCIGCPHSKECGSQKCTCNDNK